jgi:hypothetical protein
VADDHKLEAGQIEVDDSGPEVRVRLTLPQEWFTLPELRQFAVYLATVADENEMIPELGELAAFLRDARSLKLAGFDLARALLKAGYRRTSPAKLYELSPGTCANRHRDTAEPDWAGST